MTRESGLPTKLNNFSLTSHQATDNFLS